MYKPNTIFSRFEDRRRNAQLNSNLDFLQKAQVIKF